MKKKKIFIAIAFGTSVRDVLRNDTYKVLKKRKDLDIVIFIQDINEKITTEFGGDNVEFERLYPYKPSLIERILLHFHRAVLRDKCKTIDLGNTGADTRILDKFTPLARFLKMVFGYSKVNKLISWSYKTFTSPKLYKDVFYKHKPDLVIVTRVLNYSIDYALMRRAASEKVPVVSLVSSWDNLTSKAFFPFSLEKLVVWNHVLKNEAIDLFEFPEEKIFVSGIPRYDVFFREGTFSDRVTFFKKFNLDSQKKLIIYGTGSANTGRTVMDPVSPEPDICEFIADQIKEGEISESTQLLVRLHPQAKPEQYQKLIDREDVFVHIPGNKSEFQDRLFSTNDDIELGETMMHADVLVNLGSTLIIDAAVFNTPIVCVNFDFKGERPEKISIKRIYEFDHHAKLRRTGGYDLAKSKKELISQINRAIEEPTFLSKERRKIIEQQCVYDDGRSGERIANYILEVINSIS
jgi:CDP-glycerol:poly(glycerophosphate) glycerophosphotransferase